MTKAPERVRLDISTHCQLNCAWCALRKSPDLNGRTRGFLSAEKFREFLDKHPFAKRIEISNQGEVFLNPEIAEIFRIAHEKKAVITIWNGTNFNTVSDDAMDAMFKYKVQGMNVALDGASQETYSKYRRGGDFDRVIENIRRFNKFKEKHTTKSVMLAHTPVWPWHVWTHKKVVPHTNINWQYVVLPTNCDISEIRKAKAIAASLDVGMQFLADRWKDFVPPNRREVEKETGLSYKTVLPWNRRKHIRMRRLNTCAQLWKAPQINWDGRFYGCACNIYKEFGGNVFEDGLEKCLGMKLFRDTQKMLCGGPVADRSPCLRCPFYHEMVRTGVYMTRKEIEDSPC
ncbi:MAG: radical SAM protein [Rickettsiales bacterium]|nr:radical SAM protein [Rickettsiales bacterium]